MILGGHYARISRRELIGCQVVERRVGPKVVVKVAISLGQHLCFLQVAEDLAVEELVAESGVEALHIAVLPRRAGLDVERLHVLVVR